MRRMLSAILTVVLLVTLFITSCPSAVTAQSQVDAIIAFAKSKLGSTEYVGKCQAFVYQCYKAGGIDNGSASSAIAAWEKWGVSTSKTNIPVGACVYFDERVGSTYGHVGLYIGDNKMIHARASVGKVVESSMTWYFDNCYLGWGWQGGVQPYSDSSSNSISDVYKLTSPDGYQTVRSSASTSSSAVCNIPAGTYVTVTQYASNGQWGYVTYGGNSGWIRLYYVEKHTSHSYGAWTVTQSATCTATGSKKRTCSCGAVETQTIAVLGHDYASGYTVDKAATCTVAGSKSKHCTRCSAKTAVTTIPATGHSYGAWTVTQSATCTATGSKKRTCSCGAVETQTIPATGHSYGAWTVTQSATCTATGSKKRTCSCGAVETQAIAALGHDYASGYTVDKAATCTVAGSKSKHCTRCSAKTAVTMVPATGHSYGAWTVTKEATVNATGLKVRQCTHSGCTAQESAVIAKLASDGHTHSFGEWFTETAATCTTDGVQKRVCSTCKSYETASISATGHSFGEGQVEKAATCTEDGTQVHRCKRCSKTETMTLPATGHTYGDWTVTKEATADAEGSRERHCTACSATETQVIPKLDTPAKEETTATTEAETSVTESRKDDDVLTVEGAASEQKDYTMVIFVAGAATVGASLIALIVVLIRKKIV